MHIDIHIQSISTYIYICRCVHIAAVSRASEDHGSPVYIYIYIYTYIYIHAYGLIMFIYADAPIHIYCIYKHYESRELTSGTSQGTTGRLDHPPK